MKLVGILYAFNKAIVLWLKLSYITFVGDDMYTKGVNIVGERNMFDLIVYIDASKEASKVPLRLMDVNLCIQYQYSDICLI